MPVRHCVHCGKTFEPVPVNPGEEFCSDWCRKQHDRQESIVVIYDPGYYRDRPVRGMDGYGWRGGLV